MKLIEIMIMTMITLTEWEVGAADETKCVVETGRSATAESRSHDDANICRKKEKRKRGSKMAARLARVNDVEEHVLEKQAELLTLEDNHVGEDVRINVEVRKMMSFEMVRKER